MSRYTVRLVQTIFYEMVVEGTDYTQVAQAAYNTIDDGETDIVEVDSSGLFVSAIYDETGKLIEGYDV